jgi:hypothetical protein
MKLNLFKLLTIFLLFKSISASIPDSEMIFTTGRENIVGSPDWLDKHCPSQNLQTCVENLRRTGNWVYLQ